MCKIGIPADTSSLIYLAKACALAPASARLGPLLVSPAVWREAVATGEQRGAPEVARIETAVKSGLVARIDLDAQLRRRAARIARDFRLGPGESEVLALGIRYDHVLIDEHRATRAGGSLGVATVETILIPALCAQAGILDASAALALLDEIARHTTLPPEIWLRVRKRITEASP